MQAIQTKLMLISKFGERIKAECQAKYIFVLIDHNLNIDENHVEAAKQLVKIMEWDNYGNWFSGTLPDGSMCHVCNSNNSLAWSA